MWALVAASVAVASLALVIFMNVAQRRLLRRRRPPLPDRLPPLSVLKPLCGVDEDLEDNLHSIFLQAYPEFEVLLGAARADDPALAVARRVAACYPDVASRVIADPRRVGHNPKVNNLANLARHARHEGLVVSDSNVLVDPDYLLGMAAHLERPGVGLVSSPIAGRSAGTFGSELEALQLNTFVMGGVGALSDMAGGVCCVGKSMLLRRGDLHAIGGFAELGGYLAEDQVCGERMAQSGRGVVVTSSPVTNVLAPLSVADFCRRHLRWARIRRWVCPPGYAGEILLLPVFLGFLAAMAAPGWLTLTVLVANLAVKSAADAAAERRLGVRRPWWRYPLLVTSKDLLVATLWVVPFLDRRVTWRGNRFRLGPMTRLAPVPSAVLPDGPAADPAPSPVVLPWPAVQARGPALAAATDFAVPAAPAA